MRCAPTIALREPNHGSCSDRRIYRPRTPTDQERRTPGYAKPVCSCRIPPGFARQEHQEPEGGTENATPSTTTTAISTSVNSRPRSAASRKVGAQSPTTSSATRNNRSLVVARAGSGTRRRARRLFRLRHRRREPDCPAWLRLVFCVYGSVLFWCHGGLGPYPGHRSVLPRFVLASPGHSPGARNDSRGSLFQQGATFGLIACAPKAPTHLLLLILLRACDPPAKR